MSSKALLSNTLRKLSLIHLVDRIRYFTNKIKNGNRNENFRRNNPTIQIPPDYLMYESFQLEYEQYYVFGKATAEWLIDLISKYKNLENLTILDWGCGPARVIRHLPDLLDKSNNYYGTDYNNKTIEWCSQNLNNINFKLNNLTPPLQYENNYFDVVYGISIFTHLSEDLHYKWIKELKRILKENGILILTLHGDNFKEKLSKKELDRYNNGELVVRGNVKDGHRVFSSFHPKKFIDSFFKDFVILEHITRKIENKNDIPQDTYILKKE